MQQVTQLKVETDGRTDRRTDGRTDGRRGVSITTQVYCVSN